MKMRFLNPLLVFSLVFMLNAVALGTTFNVTNLTEFQSALTTAQSNDENNTINVAAGTYNINTCLSYSPGKEDNNHALTIKGAGAGSTILDGENAVNIMNIDTGNCDNDTSTITISDITFQNGSLSSTNIAGGISISTKYANITIKGNAFLGNSGVDGGAVCVWSDSSKVTLTNNTFLNNTVLAFGGGVYVKTSSGKVILANNTFNNNTSSYGGGGVYVKAYSSGTITLTNNTFNNNTSSYGGGASIYNNIAIVNIYNNILWKNTASTDGNDLYIGSANAAVNLHNNDFSGNADFDSGQSEDLYITDIDNYSHANNIQQDPLFVNASSVDFHLTASSPCIDVGDNSAPELPATDFDGNPRIINGIVDIGADEYKASGGKGGGGGGGCTISNTHSFSISFLLLFIIPFVLFVIRRKFFTR